MQKTVREIMEVREIMDMIRNGQLHYNQSTQRKFVYADMPAANFTQGSTTKSGSLLNSILEQNIQLPALYFWYNTDTNQLNIHDGKQRLLSIYYFIYPTRNISISTILNGRTYFYDGLDEELKEKLLNYKFGITYKEGNSLEEEKSFDLINSNALPLTKYECLSGMFYGTFLSEFESYIDTMSKTLDAIKPVGRGEQAYKLLLTCFNIADDKQSLGNDRSGKLLKDALRPIRQNSFNAKNYSFDKIIILFNELMRVIKGIKEERALGIANYIVRNGYDSNRLVDCYRECMRGINDIISWDMQTHKTFIDKFILNGLRLCPQRKFNKDIKDILYQRSSRCVHIDENGQRCTETSYSKLEVDHIIPWANGGQTTLDNAQLLCKHHNASKGNRE